MLPEVMDGYFGVLTDNLILVIDIGCCKVYHDVHNEHNINWKLEMNVRWDRTFLDNIWQSTARQLTKLDDQSWGNAKSWQIQETFNKCRNFWTFDGQNNEESLPKISSQGTFH